MQNLNPFGQRKFEAHALTAGGVTIYLLKRGKGNSLVKENATDIEDGAKKRIKLSELLIKAAIAVSKQYNCTLAHADKLLQGYREKDGTWVEGINPLMVLSGDDVAQFVELQDDATVMAIKAATLYIQCRLCYHVTLTSNVKSKSQVLSVEPLRYPLVEGDRIRFGETIVELQQPASDGDEELNIKPLSRTLEAGTTGFVLEFGKRTEKIGLGKWTEQDTIDFLTKEEINTIYSFYRSEEGMVELQDEPEESAEIDPVGNLPPSSTSSPPNQLTGSNSGSESSEAASAIQCSVTKTLETALVG